MASGKRRIRYEGDSVLAGDGYQFTLVLPVQEVVMVLQRGELGPAVLLGCQLHVVELVAVHCGGAYGPHLAAADQGVQGFHGLLDGSAVVETVDLIQVHVIRSQTLQGSVYLPFYCLRAQMPLVEIHFGGYHHVFPSHAQFLKSGSKILLAGAVGVLVGGVEEIDPEVKSMSYDGLGLLGIQGPGLEIVKRNAE